MDTIKIFLRKLLVIVSGFLLLGGVGGLGFIFDDGNGMNSNSNLFMIIISIILLLLGGGGLFLSYSLSKRCQLCKRWFAVQKRDTIQIQSENIYVVVENKTRSAYSGEVTETTEQHIPGKRNTYKTIYACKYCGAEKYKYKYVDTPNT